MLVIDRDGNNLGILMRQEALNQAGAQELDLVQVAPGNAERNKLPTCKIMDYGKFCYEQDKKEKEARKKQKVTIVKEIRLSVNIGENDFETKAAQAIGFLGQGYKVKVSLKFRGRENSAPSRGAEVLNKFAERCGQVGRIESPPKLEGRQMMMLLSPATQQKNKESRTLGMNTGDNKTDMNRCNKQGVTSRASGNSVTKETSTEAEFNTVNNLGTDRKEKF